jgi:hypothetical protein
MTLWKEYLQQVWENGKKLVPNPNKTEYSEDFVQMLTAYNNSTDYRAKISDEFHRWLENSKNENVSYMPKNISIKKEVDRFVDSVRSLKSQPNYQDLPYTALLKDNDFANNAILSLIRRVDLNENTDIAFQKVGDIEKIIDSDQFSYRDVNAIGKLFKNKEYSNFIHKYDKKQQDLFIKLYNLASNSSHDKEYIFTDFTDGEQFYEWIDFLSNVTKFSPFIDNLDSVVEKLKKDRSKSNLKDLAHFIETGEKTGLLKGHQLDYEELLNTLVGYNRVRDNFLDDNDLDILDQQEQLMTPEESPIEYSVIQQLKQYIKDGPNLFSGYLGAEPTLEVNLPIERYKSSVAISDFIFPQGKKYSILFTNPYKHNMIVSLEEVNLPPGGFKMNLWSSIVFENCELNSGSNYVEPLMLNAEGIVGSKLTFEDKGNLITSGSIRKNEISGSISISPDLSKENKYSNGDIYIHKKNTIMGFLKDSFENNRIHYILDNPAFKSKEYKDSDKEIVFKESNLSGVELVGPKTLEPVSKYKFDDSNLYNVTSIQTNKVSLTNSNVDRSNFSFSTSNYFFIRNSNIKNSVFSIHRISNYDDLITLNFKSHEGKSNCENCVFNYAEIFGAEKDMDFTNCIFFNCMLSLLNSDEREYLKSKNTFINSDDIFSFYTEGGISIEDVKNNIDDLENLDTHTREMKDIQDKLNKLNKDQREAVQKHELLNKRYPKLKEIIKEETESYESGQKSRAEDMHPELASVIKEFKEVTSELENNAEQIESFKNDLEFYQSEKNSFDGLLLDIHPEILKASILNYKEKDEDTGSEIYAGGDLYDKIMKYAASKNIVIGENVIKKNEEHTKTVDDYYNWENKFWK